MMDDKPSTPPRRRVAVVINPTRPELAADLLAALEAADPRLDVEVLSVEDPDQMADGVRRAITTEPTIVAAVGGDGTQHTAANCIRGSDHALAVVPGGTVNLLGQVLGIRTVEDSVRAILGGAVRTMDMGTIDGEPFLLSAGTGFDARVMRDTDDGAKRFGRLGYLITGLRALRADRPRPVTVLVDGQQVFTGRAMSVIVANVGQRASADFTMLPDARLDDGRIDVLVQRCDTALSIARAGVALARGRRPRDDDAVMGQGTRIEVRWARSVWAQRDGDAAHKGRRFTYGVLPGVLRVCVPPGQE
ncbi:MAG TPA: diacylglycerol kinase family protein [Euzebya sp.]|nr:diacylglycerol kinase family protein [Euzebya sp.]